MLRHVIHLLLNLITINDHNEHLTPEAPTLPNILRVHVMRQQHVEVRTYIGITSDHPYIFQRCRVSNAKPIPKTTKKPTDLKVKVDITMKVINS